MLFNSLSFAVFFAFLLLALFALPRRFEAPLLLGASLVFYSMWSPPFLLLLLIDVAVNYLLLRAIIAGVRPKLMLSTAVLFTMGLLGSFKYAAFAVENLMPFLHGVLKLDIDVPDVFLPLGISFYSFQILSVAFDARRGRVTLGPISHSAVRRGPLSCS